MTIPDLFYEIGIDVKGRTKGEFTTLCPKCSDDRKKKRSPCLSANLDTGMYICHHCGWKGTVTKMEKTEKKNYSLPVVNNTGLSDKALAWIESERKISKATVMRFGLYSEGREIAFPYYESDQIVHVKYRDAAKHFRSSTNTKLVPFGMQLDHGKSIIITEGEFDAMAFYEVGKLAVSCPAGATSYGWIDTSYKWFDQFEEIIIAYDSDAKGIEGRNEVARRLGRDRCKMFRYPDGVKDANDLLIGAKQHSDWKDRFLDYFQFIIPFPLEGVIKVDDLRDRILDLRKSGYPKGERTGFRGLDELITWAPGQLTVITGIPSHGKSEFTDQIMIRIKQMKWLVFSPENMPEETHLSKLIEKHIRKPFFQSTNDELTSAMDDLDDYFMFFDISKVKSIDDIVEKTREAVKSVGIRGVLIDPYSRIEHSYMGKMSETEYVRSILDGLSGLAKQLQIHVILIAHPVKMQKDESGCYIVPNLYSISGSAHFFNTADNGITVYRKPMGEGIQDRTHVYVQKVRFKWYGKPGMAEFDWNKETGCYSEIENISF
jgi:twinkle protein